MESRAVADLDTPRNRELIARAAALPSALVLAWFLVRAEPGPVRLLTMWVHESGHAATAWLCGYAAWPTAWVTMVPEQPSRLFSVLLVAGLGIGGYSAWQLRRWFWVSAAAATLLLMLFCTSALGHVKADELITFGGDAGSLVLGTILMLTMYARENHPIRENQLRWAFLVIGALAFMDAYTVWSGPIDRLPFGEDENGLSDPSKLTEVYGWNVLMLIRRYRELAFVCFGVMAIVYLAELYRAAAPADEP